MIGTSLARIVKDIPLFGHALSWGFLGVFGFWSIGFYFHFRKNESALFDFGRWHASPQARTWDAFSWTTYKHGCSRSGSFFHFVLVAVVPLFAALTADFPSLSKGDGAVYFSVSGLVTGVLIELLESKVRDEQYARSEQRTFAEASLSNAIRAAERKIAKAASWAGLVEWIVGILLIALAFEGFIPTSWMPSVLLGFAFVAVADAMSVASTWFLVVKKGAPFVRKEPNSAEDAAAAR